MTNQLNDLIRDWKRQGSPPQEALEWVSLKKNWTTSFPKYKDFINQLPDRIDRNCLRAVCNDRNSSVVESFLAVMIWGYGNLGYGSYRVSKMIDFSGTEKILEIAKRNAQVGKPKEAYLYLMNNRIPVLGPSYTSKYISFCTPRSESAPILDSLILKWIQKYSREDFCHFNLNRMSWNPDLYSDYCDWVEQYASKFGIYSDDVELVLFKDAEREFST